MRKLIKFLSCGEVETTSTGKLLYLVLIELANKNGEVIVSQRKISDTLNISKGTISRNLHRLCDGGYIDIQATYHNDGGRAANKYRIR